MGGTITVTVYFGSLLLYSNTTQKVEGTTNLPQMGTYTFQTMNNNDFEIEFLLLPTWMRQDFSCIIHTRSILKHQTLLCTTMGSC